MERNADFSPGRLFFEDNNTRLRRTIKSRFNPRDSHRHSRLIQGKWSVPAEPFTSREIMRLFVFGYTGPVARNRFTLKLYISTSIYRGLQKPESAYTRRHRLFVSSGHRRRPVSQLEFSRFVAFRSNSSTPRLSTLCSW